MKEYDAFISYHRGTDYSTAQLISDRLEDYGLKSFVDVHESKPGVFSETIVKAIENSPNMIVIMSEDSLEKCKHPEDWVRKEIEIALEKDKNIIPVFFHSFEWPIDWDPEYPESIRGLSHMEGVPLYPNYLDIGVDNLTKLLKEVDLKEKADRITNLSSYDYFRIYTENVDEIKEVQMAFHAGQNWFSEPKISLLEKFLENNIKVKVLINAPEAAEIVGKHMRRPMVHMIPFAECVKIWNENAAHYPELLEVRVCNIPLLHIFQTVKNIDPKKDTMRINYYIYKNSDLSRSTAILLSKASPYFDLYQNEFDYLWNNSENIKEFCSREEN